jgi:hypothetical protein
MEEFNQSITDIVDIDISQLSVEGDGFKPDLINLVIFNFPEKILSSIEKDFSHYRSLRTSS